MKQLLPILTLIILGACATIVPPNGGPRDKDAPKDSVDLSYPNTNNQLNFSDDHFDLYFNEPVKVANLKANLNSSPLLNEGLEVKITKEKKGLYKTRFTFNETLQPNTTYIIQLGKSIVDLTENNAANNPTMVFSTGSYIDSLELSGKITSNLTNTPSSNYLIGLYETHDSIDPSVHFPIYSAKTNNDGNFSITHLKSRTYRVICFKDLDNNKLYTPNTEPVGFVPGLLDVHKNIDTNITTFFNPKDSLVINPIRHRLDKSLLTTNKPPTKIEITTHAFINKVSSNEWHFYNQSKDSLPILITTLDSLGKSTSTQTFIPVHQTNESTNTFNTTHPNYNREYTGDTICIPIRSPLPILKIDKTKIRIASEKDSIELSNIPHTITHTFDNTYQIKLWNIPDTGTIQFLPGAITDITNQQSIRKDLLFLPLNPKNYGSLGAKITTEEKHYTLQVLDSRKKIIYQYENPESIELKNIPANEYFFRVMIDSDNNGLYNYGSYENQELPEPIYYYPNVIKLKPNWEIMDIAIEF